VTEEEWLKISFSRINGRAGVIIDARADPCGSMMDQAARCQGLEQQIGTGDWNSYGEVFRITNRLLLPTRPIKNAFDLKSPDLTGLM